jgi:hypothetical protein
MSPLFPSKPAAACVIGVLSMAGSGPLAADVVGHWRFENGSALGTDSGAGGLGLTLSSNAPASVSSTVLPTIPASEAVNLLAADLEADSVNHFYRADSAAFNFQDFTIEAVVSLESNTTTSTPRTIASQFQSSPNSQGWLFGVAGGGTSLSNGARTLFLQLSSSGSSNTVVQSPFQLSIGNSYYLAASVDFSSSGTIVTFYIKDLTSNGALLAANVGAGVTALFNSTANFAVGASYDGAAARVWDGRLDEVRLSSAALVLEQLYIYQESTGGGTFDPMAIQDQITVIDTDPSQDPSSFLLGAYEDSENPGTLLGGFDTQYNGQGSIDFILRSADADWTWWTAAEDGSGAKEAMSLQSEGGLVLYGRDGSGNPVESIKLIPQDGSVASSIQVDGAKVISQNSNGQVRWGNGARATGLYATAWGLVSSSPSLGATGDYSTVWGRASASELYGTAWGWGRAEGQFATAWGESAATEDFATTWGAATAWAEYGTAWGSGSARGEYSTSFGGGTRINSIAGLAIGTYNVGVSENEDIADYYSQTLSEDTVIFEIGNGFFDANSNALTFYRKGDMRLSGKLEARHGVRVPEQGDISMGEFTTGQDPAEMEPGTGLLYPES